MEMSESDQTFRQRPVSKVPSITVNESWTTPVEYPDPGPSTRAPDNDVINPLSTGMTMIPMDDEITGDNQFPPNGGSGAPSYREDDHLSAAPSGFDERNTFVGVRRLGVFDVFALVFNKQVGTGIFTTPGLVLKLTQSKSVSLGLWVAGGIYTAFCLLIYLQLGIWYPYNGGELIYLDKICKSIHRRGPGFLFAMFFAAYQISFGFTAGNAIAFARYSILAAKPTYESNSDLDPRVTKLIAIVVLGAVCLVLNWSGHLAMFLNKALAVYKVFFLLVVIGLGFTVGRDHTPVPPAAPAPDGGQFENIMSAFILIVYSYSGWENANYVAGEIRELSDDAASNPWRQSIRLVGGAMSAVLLCMLLYVLVVGAYYASESTAAIIDVASDLGMGTNFGPRAFGGSGRSFKILVTISALGNLVSVVYTSSKVKQAIARQRFLPFWRLIELDKDTPKGGLALHWIVTTIWILALPNDSDGYSFIIGMSAWGRILIESLVISGFIVLLLRKSVPNSRPWDLAAGVLAVALAVFDWLIDVLSAKAKSKGTIPRYYWGVAISVAFGVALIYWLFLKIMEYPTRNRSTSIEMRQGTEAQRLQQTGRADANETIRHRPSLRVHVYERRDDIDHNWPVEMNGPMADAQLEGSDRRVRIEYTGHVPDKLSNAWNETWRLIVRYLL